MHNLVQEVIAEGLKDFVPGLNNITFLTMVKLGIRPGSRSVPDPAFKSEANTITGTNFIASVGPQFEDLGNLFSDTTYNTDKPISQIVAICDPAMLYDTPVAEGFNDCYDYFFEPRTVNATPFVFDIKREATHLHEEKNTAGIIQSKLSIQKTTDNAVKTDNRELNVTFFAVKDGKGIPLISDAQKQVVWDLYQYSLNHPILVHCRMGIGRTGTFIFMLEILRQFDTLFASKNAREIAQKILDVLKSIRQSRPALVLEREQFAAAIEQAYILHDFALKKGYLQSLIEMKQTPAEEDAEESQSTEQNNKRPKLK